MAHGACTCPSHAGGAGLAPLMPFSLHVLQGIKQVDLLAACNNAGCTAAAPWTLAPWLVTLPVEAALGAWRLAL
jgi:hypothetical protein